MNEIKLAARDIRESISVKNVPYCLVFFSKPHNLSSITRQFVLSSDMHPFKLLQLALLVTSAAAVPLDAPIQEQKVPAIYQNCIEAVNCEVYEEDGHYNIRFVEGKGINSAWYNETFKDYNETLVAEVPTNGSRVLNRGVNCQGNVCTVRLFGTI